MSGDRRAAADYALVGGGLVGGSLAADGLVEADRRRRGMSGPVVAAARRKFTRRHAAHVGAKLAGRAALVTGAPMAAYGAYRMVKPEGPVPKISLKRDVAKPMAEGLAFKDLVNQQERRLERAAGEHVGKELAQLSQKDQDRIRRRKKVGTVLSLTGAGIGTAALGLRAPEAARALVKVPRVGKLRPVRSLANREGDATKVSNSLLAVGAGVGAAGGFNYADQQRLEAKQFKKSSQSSSVKTARLLMRLERQPGGKASGLAADVRDFVDLPVEQRKRAGVPRQGQNFVRQARRFLQGDKSRPLGAEGVRRKATRAGLARGRYEQEAKQFKKELTKLEVSEARRRKYQTLANRDLAIGATAAAVTPVLVSYTNQYAIPAANRALPKVAARFPQIAFSVPQIPYIPVPEAKLFPVGRLAAPMKFAGRLPNRVGRFARNPKTIAVAGLAAGVPLTVRNWSDAREASARHKELKDRFREERRERRREERVTKSLYDGFIRGIGRVRVVDRPKPGYVMVYDSRDVKRFVAESRVTPVRKPKAKKPKLVPVDKPSPAQGGPEQLELFKALSAQKKAEAKARAKKAGRPYPNAYDNMVSGGAPWRVKKDDRFLRQYRDRISPSAEEGYKYLKQGRNRHAVNAGVSAGFAGLSGGLGVHSLRRGSKGWAAVGGAGAVLSSVNAVQSARDAARWNSRLGKIKAKAREREVAGEFGRGRVVEKGVPSGARDAALNGVKYAKYRVGARERGRILAREIARGNNLSGARVISGRVHTPIDVNYPSGRGGLFVAPGRTLTLSGSRHVRTRARKEIANGPVVEKHFSRNEKQGAAMVAGGAGALAAGLSSGRVVSAYEQARIDRIDRKIARAPKAKRQKVASQLGVKRKKILNRKRGFKTRAGMLFAGYSAATPLVWLGARKYVEKADKHDVDAFMAGGLAGAGAYQGAGYLTQLTGWERRNYERFPDSAKQVIARHERRVLRPNGERSNPPKGHPAWKKHGRTYPKTDAVMRLGRWEIPAHTYKRVMSRLQGGKTQVVITAGVAGAAGLGAAAVNRKVHPVSERGVEKSVFRRIRFVPSTKGVDNAARQQWDAARRAKGYGPDREAARVKAEQASEAGFHRSFRESKRLRLKSLGAGFGYGVGAATVGSVAAAETVRRKKSGKVKKAFGLPRVRLAPKSVLGRKPAIRRSYVGTSVSGRRFTVRGSVR